MKRHATFFLAVFLGFSKRRAELAELSPLEENHQRPVLADYTVQFLDYLVNSSAVMKFEEPVPARALRRRFLQPPHSEVRDGTVK